VHAAEPGFTAKTQRTRRKRGEAGGTAIPGWVFDTPHLGERSTGGSACATGAASYVAQALLPVRFLIIAGIAPLGTVVTAVARMFSRRARLKLFTLPERDQARRVPKVKFPLVLIAASLVLVSGAPALARPGATSSTGANSPQQKRVIQVPMKVVYAKILHTVDPIYPPAAKAKGIQGTVSLKGMIGTDGRAHDLKVVSGPSALVGAAEDAVRKWTFTPATFDGKPRAVPWEFHLNFRMDETREEPKRIEVGSVVMSQKLVHKVAPDYPADAQRKGIHGDVVLRALVGKDGRVKSLDLVSGNPILAKAAVAAVRQWVYEPTLIHGEPVDVHLTVTVSFAKPR
jgi:TonB family protein